MARDAVIVAALVGTAAQIAEECCYRVADANQPHVYNGTGMQRRTPQMTFREGAKRMSDNVDLVVRTFCPFCGVRKTGHSLRCHIQACSMRNKPMDRKEKHALSKSTTAKP